jgi:hypothetical protein
MIYRLHIDGHAKLVRSTPARLYAAMCAHIRAERAKGRPLAEIQFCWTPVHIGKI